MSITIKNNLNILITQGDSGLLIITKTEENILSPFIDGDIVTFRVKRRISDTTALIEKIVNIFTEDGAAEIILDGSDTNDISVGVYMYGVTWTDGAGNVKTIVPGSGKPDLYPQFEVIENL